ncbi:transcription factor HIVEP3 [Betta splendens]|uniref:Transcription factor HIVEP3 n=1 Tax=Betta splendens TaxID=158456 RepID=A0A6P7NRI9_BETSP|nr:transcription factor HIVEP3 [Betta splendens]XP_029022523.1 transcription factor HIVEP3 [Betta splendens]XP_055368784.1 transcription factor HIVEP3 [Betta splendens]
METLHSRLTTGEQSGGQERCQLESSSRSLPKSPSRPSQQQQTDSPKPHGTLQQPKPLRRQNPERKRLRNQRQSVESDTGLEPKHVATKASTLSCLPAGVPSSSADDLGQSKPDTQEGTPKQKRERKPQRPGKYVCTYCGRACAKPSVLQKHIRSHTGERPYPCAPCGFSFKTKSNLYKHRKSHTHKVKAGLALGEPRSVEEQVTESEDETRQISSASCHTEGTVASVKSHEADKAKDCTPGNNDSYAVKKRLALRLSRGKQGAQDSSDDKTQSQILGSRGSTESGYFSRSESTEQSQDSPPNTSAKSYAEIILGKYGRLGHLQRMSRHHNQQPSGQEDKSIPFTVPKKEVIEHITKLITINEAVVDTSKIDSVKPRRFSLSRKNSSESQKSSSLKEPFLHSPKPGDLSYKSSGSITMGVPCEKFHNPSQNLDQPPGQTSTTPLVRSQSMPTACGAFDLSTHGPSKFRQSHSFDERRPSEMQASRRYGMLRRQPAIEIPLGAELTEEEHEGSHSFLSDGILSPTAPDHKQSQAQPYKCEVCCIGCKDWESYTRHKCSQLISTAARAGVSTLRKRRKEDSFEFDDPSSPPLPVTGFLSGPCRDEASVAYAGPRRPPLQTCSVIQHTSSFEKQELLYNKSHVSEATSNSSPKEEYQLVPQNQEQQSTKVASRKLLHQHSVQVPEILVTEDSNMSSNAAMKPACITKHAEKPDDFQWPQRSPSLAQLPIEKLPPKKKRLRLTEAVQSSGESSFDSISLPHSPSQASSASYSSSRSTSFEESNRTDMETMATPLRRSRASHMLTVPRVHQHREMRRSASEQAPHEPQPGVLMAETRSKSFDYSCLSPERTAIGWRERRKCLLMRHTAVTDPDEEEEEQVSVQNHATKCVTTSTSSEPSPTYAFCTRSPPSLLSGDADLRPSASHFKGIFPQWEQSKNLLLTDTTEPSAAPGPPLHPIKKEPSYIHTSQPPQPNSAHGPSGAARAHYLPVSTGLKLEIPLKHNDYLDVQVGRSQTQQITHITSSLELVTAVSSPSVAVLQTETLMPACAIYTTLSQSTSPTPQEAIDAISHNVGIPAADYINRRNTVTDFKLWSDDDLRLSGSGGNKRMLSPSNSIELPPESQQQQKRVKEEGETGAECVEAGDKTNQDFKQENRSCLNRFSPVTHARSSFPSLLSSTCNSWCYLNYIKPNPSTLDEQKPSVYSSWSTSGYDPNPPGLSSKTALALLHCKQRLSPSIYTTSLMSVKTTESVEPEDNIKPAFTEVNNIQWFCDETKKGQDSSDDGKSGGKEEERAKKDFLSCSRNKHPETWLSEKGSNETQGDCGGTSQSEGCGNSLERSSGLQKCTDSSTQSLTRKHCKDTFKAEGVCEDSSVYSIKEKDDQDSDLLKNGGDERSAKSKATESSSDKEEPQRGGSPKEPEPSRPKDAVKPGSASARRALFAQRRINASASASTSEHHSPSPQIQAPQREPPLPCSLSPEPHGSPGTPPASPSSCHVSNSPPRAESPVRGSSPAVVQSHGSDSSEPLSSSADTSASCLHSRDYSSTVRLSVEEVGLTHVAPLPTRLRGAHNLLSHLPLHSQQLSRASSQLIPIGGIHMIQPRSPLPLYSLVSPPTAVTSRPAGSGTSWRISSTPKTRSPLLLQQQQDPLKEVTSGSRASPTDDAASGGMPRSSQSDAPLRRQNQGCSIQLLPQHLEVGADSTETCVYPETTQGQKKTPSSQTQL